MRHRTVLWGVLLLLELIAITQAAPLRQSVRLNAAHLMLNHSLWADGQMALVRQQQLGQAADLLHAAVGPDGALAAPADAPCKMVKRVALAEQFRGLRRLAGMGRAGRPDSSGRAHL
jgi:hypothetical protein